MRTTELQAKHSGYFRDSETGLDYADQRYHQPGMGRFTTPDRYTNSAGPNDPGSWNRYAYTRGDPVNRTDHSGTDDDECGAFGASDCGDGFASSDPMNTGVQAPPGLINVYCSFAYGDNYASNASACTISPEQYEELVEGPACPDNVAAFFEDFSSEFLSIAQSLNTSFEMIASFAAFESDYANQAHRNSHNLFSELQKKNGKWGMIPWNNFTNEENYVKKALGTPVSQGGVLGIVDPGEFANQLVNRFWSGDPRSVYVAGFTARYTQVVNYEPICADAIALGLSHPSLP